MCVTPDKHNVLALVDWCTTTAEGYVIHSPRADRLVTMYDMDVPRDHSKCEYKATPLEGLEHGGNGYDPACTNAVRLCVCTTEGSVWPTDGSSVH